MLDEDANTQTRLLKVGSSQGSATVGIEVVEDRRNSLKEAADCSSC